MSGDSHATRSSSSTRLLHSIQISCGSLKSTGKKIANLCEGDGRDGKVVKILQIVLCGPSRLSDMFGSNTKWNGMRNSIWYWGHYKLCKFDLPSIGAK